MPQLDGLRAIAITLVVLHHYDLPGGGAVYGVHLFFLLSGFLITGILIKAKTAVLAGAGSCWLALRQFYVRRCLRIFPLYYLVVLAGMIVGAEYAREYAPWLLTYTINFKFADQGWYITNFAHFWSLAVEEQYYLVWPWVVLLIPSHWLRRAAWAMVAVGPLYRLGRILAWRYFDAAVPVLHTYISTFAVLDSIGFGSLLAIASSETSPIAVRRQLAFVGWPVAFFGLLALAWVAKHFENGHDLHTVAEDTLFAESWAVCCPRRRWCSWARSVMASTFFIRSCEGSFSISAGAGTSRCPRPTGRGVRSSRRAQSVWRRCHGTALSDRSII